MWCLTFVIYIFFTKNWYQSCWFEFLLHSDGNTKWMVWYLIAFLHKQYSWREYSLTCGMGRIARMSNMKYDLLRAMSQAFVFHSFLPTFRRFSSIKPVRNCNMICNSLMISLADRKTIVMVHNFLCNPRHFLSSLITGR